MCACPRSREPEPTRSSGAGPSFSAASTSTADVSGSAAKNGRRGHTSMTRSSRKVPASTSSRSRARPPSSSNRRLPVAALIVLAVFALFILVMLAKTVRVIPQARAGVVERFGRYARTLSPGLTIVIPFIDRVRPLLDLREQVISFDPQPVITEDNLVVNIDTVLYFQITDPKSATYEIANPVDAIDMLSITTLRNLIGGMTLEQALTSRDQINDQLRGILDEATGKWGIRVHRVELKAVDPPPSIKDTMEKQMRADREKRAAILQAEGIKQAAILTAEGEKQSAILKAEGQKQAAILAAQGESEAIGTVFQAIHERNPDPQLLAYQSLQVLPQTARGDANKGWVIPSDLTRALGRLGNALPRKDDET